MWRKSGKGEGLPINNPLRLKPLKEFGPSPYHQQKTGLFRNTMIAPATHKPATGTDPPLRGLQYAVNSIINDALSYLRLRSAADKGSVPMAPVSFEPLSN